MPARASCWKCCWTAACDEPGQRVALKYLILLGVILVVAWWTLGRRGRGPRKPGGASSGAAQRTKGNPAAAQAMLACAHCGVHLPRSEALFDAEQQPFCSDAHRLAGPSGGPR